MDYTTYLDLFCTIPAPTIKPEVPLYRYRGNAKHALDEIRKQYVFTNYAGDQNDPIDSSYRMTREEDRILLCYILDHFCIFVLSETARVF